MAKGRSVRLFLADGTATGILTAEIMNWTGHVLAAPRTRLEDALLRDELRRTGVYFLIGPDDEGTDLLKVYVGEGDEIAKRLYQHNKEKAFWERFIAVTSKDMNLTKAHVRYLEGKLLGLVAAAKKAKLDNKDLPNFGLLPEADIADMETFLEEIQLILPVIGVDLLRRPPSRGVSAAPSSRPPWSADTGLPTAIETDGNAGPLDDGPLFVLKNPQAGIDASAREISGEFVIIRGSRGSLKEKSSFNERMKSIRDDAFQTGRALRLDDKTFVVEEDIALSSPSAAAVFLYGTSRNGRADWLVEGRGVSYGAWKDALIERRQF
jgi:hypothetical protein